MWNRTAAMTEAAKNKTRRRHSAKLKQRILSERAQRIRTQQRSIALP